MALGGSVAINLAAAGFLLATAILQPSATRRGRLLTWLMAAGLFPVELDRDRARRLTPQRAIGTLLCAIAIAKPRQPPAGRLCPRSSSVPAFHQPRRRVASVSGGGTARGASLAARPGRRHDLPSCAIAAVSMPSSRNGTICSAARVATPSCSRRSIGIGTGPTTICRRRARQDVACRRDGPPRGPAHGPVAPRPGRSSGLRVLRWMGDRSASMEMCWLGTCRTKPRGCASAGSTSTAASAPTRCTCARCAPMRQLRRSAASACPRWRSRPCLPSSAARASAA